MGRGTCHHDSRALPAGATASVFARHAHEPRSSHPLYLGRFEVRIPTGAPHLRIGLTQQSERTGIENKWFALAGRVVALKAEKDGDLHIVLRQATSRGSLLLKYQQNRGGVQFVKRFSAGRGLDFLFTLALLRS